MGQVHSVERPPVELLSEVAKYLSPEDRNSLAQVCRSYHDNLRDELAWLDVQFITEWASRYVLSLVPRATLQNRAMQIAARALVYNWKDIYERVVDALAPYGSHRIQMYNPDFPGLMARGLTVLEGNHTIPTICVSACMVLFDPVLGDRALVLLRCMSFENYSDLRVDFVDYWARQSESLADSAVSAADLDALFELCDIVRSVESECDATKFKEHRFDYFERWRLRQFMYDQITVVERAVHWALVRAWVSGQEGVLERVLRLGYVSRKARRFWGNRIKRIAAAAAVEEIYGMCRMFRLDVPRAVIARRGGAFVAGVLRYVDENSRHGDWKMSTEVHAYVRLVGIKARRTMAEVYCRRCRGTPADYLNATDLQKKHKHVRWVRKRFRCLLPVVTI